MKMNGKWLLGMALGVGLVGSIVSSPARADDPKIPGPNSYVRFAHYLVKGDKVDVFVDGKRILNDIGFDTLSKYIRFSSGYHNFRITTNNPTRVLFAGSRTLKNNDFYSIIAYGTPSRPRSLVNYDSAGSVPYGKARLTVNNLSPGMPAFNVVAYPVKGSERKIVLARNVRYGQSRTFFIPTGQMTVKLTSGGYTLKTIKGASPREGRRYGLYATGESRTNFKAILDTIAQQ